MLNEVPKTVPESRSISFAKISRVAWMFKVVFALSFTAIGTSLTQTTVTATVAIFDHDGQKLSAN